MAWRDPSLRSGFRPRAPAALTPANRLNFTRGNLVGDSFGKDMNAGHWKKAVLSWSVSQMGGEKQSGQSHCYI
jgi:hypothetical protein